MSDLYIFYNVWCVFTDSKHVHKIEVKVPRKVRDPAIQPGNPLPDDGTCRHYKKSYRWLR